MAARRNRRRRNRGRFGFLYKLLSVVLILCAIAAGCIVFFRVEKITITGSTVYTDEQIIAAADVEPGDNLFLINIVQVGRKIIGQLPYIDEVNPRRQLPNTITFHVTECEPVGILAGENGIWWVLDSSGKLLEQGGAELKKEYLQITGITPLMPSAGSRTAVAQEESEKLNSLKQVLSALEERGMVGDTQSIDLSAVSEIRMEYADLYLVRLPMYDDDFHLLIHTLQAVSEKSMVAGRPGTIDLTGEQARFIPD